MSSLDDVGLKFTTHIARTVTTHSSTAWKLNFSPSFFYHYNSSEYASPFKITQSLNMSGNSSVGNSGVYEAGDQVNVPKAELEQEKKDARFHEGKENSHKSLDSKDERSIANKVRGTRALFLYKQICWLSSYCSSNAKRRSVTKFLLKSAKANKDEFGEGGQRMHSAND